MQREERLARAVGAFIVLLLASACAPATSPAANAFPSRLEIGGPVETLLSGTFAVPAANAFGDPGFHQVLSGSGVLPTTLPETQGRRLIVSLRDAGRPAETCSQQHPLSGCATVDWSDDPTRPNVPAGGVFLNRITVQLAGGSATFYLSQDGSLRNRPDPFTPG